MARQLRQKREGRSARKAARGGRRAERRQAKATNGSSGKRAKRRASRRTNGTAGRRTSQRPQREGRRRRSSAGSATNGAGPARNARQKRRKGLKAVRSNGGRARQPANPIVATTAPAFDIPQRGYPGASAHPGTADTRVPYGAALPALEFDYPWADDEIALDRDYGPGERGGMVKTIQEWLSLHGIATGIDGDYGDSTATAVATFQAQNGLPETGITDDETFALLVSPMLRALQPIDPGSMTLGELAVAYANQHLAEHPRELGENEGPWVRLYMEGNEGPKWYWCAGFACFILRQAADTLGIDMPFDPTFSCDEIANGASDEDFVTEDELADGTVSLDDMPVGSVFLNRKSIGDWDHTGIVTAFYDDSIETIEGNTNDEGNRNGYEVCRRVRSYTDRDFVRVDG